VFVRGARQFVRAALGLPSCSVPIHSLLVLLFARCGLQESRQGREEEKTSETL